ncbi:MULTISPECIES: hypothetical protein [Cysteiniphilum]|uniref:hypothetical protein n=1 Tax=Cysteiniphilum TaxID=2056696 RepID=UPI00177D0F7D|nr:MULTISPECIES: hypothetical protein [Cysteiniphilum]
MLDITAVLAEFAEINNFKFTLHSQQKSLPEVFAYNGILPYMLARLDQRVKYIFNGRGISVNYFADKNALLGKRVQLNESKERLSFLLLMLCDQMISWQDDFSGEDIVLEALFDAEINSQYMHSVNKVEESKE